ncbi:MAG: glycosyltransferase family 2 protein [Candidatus Woesearchaeota archaeon]
MGGNAPEVSVVMPCLNEEATIGICIAKAKRTIERLKLNAEIVISDNGSTDKSVSISKALGARVVHQPLKGYGMAYLKGFAEARGKYIVMGDSDDSYDWTDIGRFITPLREGYDMVMGSRLKGKIDPGAMPVLHRRLGNPILTAILRLFFGVNVSDAHCGMRSITKSALKSLDLRTGGMEFASEMVIKAGQRKLKIKEVPIRLRKDKRVTKPHLRTWRDGWRHLRFMLLMSPTWLFLIPGAIAFTLGILLMILLSVGPLFLGILVLDIHTLLVSSLLTILGAQLLGAGLFAKMYAFRHGIALKQSKAIRLLERISLEKGVLIGLVVVLAGLVLDAIVLFRWILNDFGNLDAIRPAVLGSTLIILGFQVIFSSFFTGILSLNVSSRGNK